MTSLSRYFLLSAALFYAFNVAAQQIPNWQNKDLAKDSLFGISTEKAYQLLRDKKSQPVIVAVIDAGVDTLHEDLKSVLWINPKKKTFDNGTYGWSYLGSAKGNVHYDNLELTRQVLPEAEAIQLRAELQSLFKTLSSQLDELQLVSMSYENVANKIRSKASVQKRKLTNRLKEEAPQRTFSYPESSAVSLRC